MGAIAEIPATMTDQALQLVPGVGPATAQSAFTRFELGGWESLAQTDAALAGLLADFDLGAALLSRGQRRGADQEQLRRPLGHPDPHPHRRVLLAFHANVHSFRGRQWHEVFEDAAINRLNGDRGFGPLDEGLRPGKCQKLIQQIPTALDR